MATCSTATKIAAASSKTAPARYRAILLFGAPGSGKGTQGKVIGAIPGFLHSSTGDIFRALDKKSDMGKVFLQYSTRGELVPDEFTIKLWKQHMAGLVAAGKFDPKQGTLVMDGVPRNAKQAELLKDSIDVVKIICLEARDMEEMVQRLRARAVKENRPDDADVNVIRNRMAVYERETKPVLDCYPADKIVKVDANQCILKVASDVFQVLMGL